MLTDCIKFQNHYKHHWLNSLGNRNGKYYKIMNFAWENTLPKSNYKEIIYSYPKNLVHLDNLC